jgi:cysteinyl-tRNA synthetase
VPKHLDSVEANRQSRAVRRFSNRGAVPSVIGLTAIAVVAVFPAGCGSRATGGAVADAGQSPNDSTAEGGGSGVGDGGPGSDEGGRSTGAPKRGFPEAGPWVSFYGPVQDADVVRLASTFRIMNLEVDPDSANVTKTQLIALQARAAGQNRVISYLNMGACETYRSYYATAPAGFASCVSSGALTTVYSPQYPDEKWANLSNAAYRKLMVEYVAQRLWDQGIDGFFLDNLEVVEHGAGAASGPCDAACAQDGLDLVWELRQRFPDALIVMQNATSDVTRTGTTHGVAYSAGADPGALTSAADEPDHVVLLPDHHPGVNALGRGGRARGPCSHRLAGARTELRLETMRAPAVVTPYEAVERLIRRLIGHDGGTASAQARAPLAIASTSSLVSSIFLAFQFSSRCSGELVPGMGSITGDRARSHAMAICAGVARCFSAAAASAGCGRPSAPIASGKNGR